MGLSTQEQILIEQKVTNERKSIGLAYALWLFPPGMGMHRFYLASPMGGLLMLVLFIVCVILAINNIGAGIFAILLTLFWLIDAFLIPSLVRRHQNAVRTKLTVQALADRGEVYTPELDISKWSAADKERYRQKQLEQKS